MIGKSVPIGTSLAGPIMFLMLIGHASRDCVDFIDAAELARLVTFPRLAGFTRILGSILIIGDINDTAPA